MSKQIEKTLVPELRFPEFRDAEEWNEKFLGDCLDYLQPTKYLVKSTAYNNSYKTPVLTAGKTFILGYTDESHGIFENKLPVIIFDDFTTATKYVNFPFKAKSSAMKILLAKENTNIKFIYEAMQVIKYEIGAHERHWISKFAKLNIAIPTPSEQQKIADCLSSIDDLITAYSQKHDSLKAHKKGLMQQLFPAEGETVPKRRFPEFRDAGEWNVSTMEGISTISSGGTPSRTVNDYWNGSIPWATTTLIDFNTISLTNEYITEEGLQNSSTKVLPKNTILMAMYGQGKTRGKVAILGIEAAINQACAAVTLKKGFNTNFVFQNLAGRYNEIRNISNEGGQKNLSATLISVHPFIPSD